MAFTLFPDKMKQWKVVLIAFATATTFWFFNSLNKNYTTTLKHPVEFSFDSHKLIAVKSLPTTIELDVSGGGWNLLRKNPWFSPSPVVIKLKNPVGVRFISWIELLPMIRDQMTEITVNRVLQDTLNIQIEPLLSKKVTLWVDSLDLNLKESHRIVSAIKLPEPAITLTGPKSFIDTLGTKFQLLINEKGIDNQFDRLVDVNSPSPSLIKSNPAQVRVKFEVDKFDRLQIELPVEPLNFPSDSSRYIKENLITVFFTVQRSRRTDYIKKNFKVQADYKTISRRDTSISAALTLFPGEITDIELVPSTLTIIKK